MTSGIIVHKMMKYHYCPFDAIATSQVYVCYNAEVCCNEGCCLPSAYTTNIHIWHNWLLLCAAFVLVLFIMWLCGKMAKRPAHAPNAIAPTTNCSPLPILQYLPGVRTSPPRSEAAPPTYTKALTDRAEEYNRLFGPPPDYASLAIVAEPHLSHEPTQTTQI